jgi:hypothetical protein
MKCLMDAKKAKKITGIHGRLGDLATIDAKYDVAITTACGALNNIVVENTQVRRSPDFQTRSAFEDAAVLRPDVRVGLASLPTLTHALALLFAPSLCLSLTLSLFRSLSLTHTHSLSQVAQRCCDLLRSSGAGVATFLMLDKQRHLADKMHKPAESFPAPRLFDLVQAKDEAFLPAFYFALRDTLVAENLEVLTFDDVFKREQWSRAMAPTSPRGGLVLA